MAVGSVVSYLIAKLDSLLGEELKLMKGISTEVCQIKDELQSMSAFLSDADSRADSEAGLKEWVTQVREAAYNIEDVLDEYALRLIQEPIHNSHEVMIFLRKTMHNIKKLKERRQIAKKIQKLKIDVDNISSRAKKYKFEKIEHGTSSSNAPFDTTSHLRSIARFTEEAKLVGIGNPRTELIGLLVAGESRLMMISIVGMGGLGKTTLAGKVYDNEQVKTHFEAFAWVTLSQMFNIEEIFISILKQICEPQIRVDKMGKDELIPMLRGHLLQKRYVIVLDDLWKVDHWECIEVGFPNGECGSRIMVTTRISEVADACARTSDHVYNLSPLSFEQSWALFCNKAFQSDSGGNCPPHLKQISETFVQKCGGLPLAIVTIGSLLRNKPKTLAEWQKLYNSLGHQIDISGRLTNMNQILSLSFNDLPYCLKACLMYLSIFPEDYSIKPMRLIQLWIAEGFVERKQGITLEELADDYLIELIKRSLIQVASYTDYGTLKACRLHDVVREIILSKAREEKFLTFQNGTEVIDKTRCLALQDDVKIAPNNDLPHLRSFFRFGRAVWTVSSMKAWFCAFRLLKVLDLEGTKIEDLPSEIVNLFHLRYLNLRGTCIRTLPEDIGKLKKLETLILGRTLIQELPTSIVNLVYLRSLLLQDDYFTTGVKVSPRVRNLRFLQQLGFIYSDHNDVLIQELEELTQLKWLGISKVTSKDVQGLCASIEKMTCLSSLSVVSVNHELLDFKHISSPPPFLEHVYLDGWLEVLPHWIPSLSNLVHLKLKSSLLKKDPFDALQHLPNLMKLELLHVYNGHLHCEERGFQRLKSLSICTVSELTLILKKGGMPNLHKLLINDRHEFKAPFGIKRLTRLDFTFGNAADASALSIERVGSEEHWKIEGSYRKRF